MKYVLFVLLAKGWGTAPVAAITSAEFESEAACSAAAAQIEKLYEVNHVGTRIPMSLWCLPKGTPDVAP